MAAHPSSDPMPPQALAPSPERLARPLPSLPSPARRTQTALRPRWCRFLLGTLALLWLAGCALPAEPSPSDPEALLQETQAIALAYQASGDLEAAERSLQGLEVANTQQWVILATETSIQRGAPDEVIGALVALMQALRLTSPLVEQYLQGPARPIAPSEPALATAGQTAEPTTPATVPDTPPAQETSPALSPTASPTVPVAPTPTPPPQVVTRGGMNVRAGPGTQYPVIGAMGPQEQAPILGKNPAGDWWQIRRPDGSSGWIYGPLVDTAGDVSGVAVAASIPTPPPATPTPVPVPTATPIPPGPDFRLVEQRLWDVEENGGFLAGESVNCGEKQILRVLVLDAAGNPLNGVTVKGVYRNEYRVTGEKGPGIAEFDVNVHGDDILVVRDVDGREVTSDVAVGNTARTYDIPFEQLIQGRFCKDPASCQAFVDTLGCFGHFSWTVIFQRSY